MKNIKLSIVVPVYNAEKYLPVFFKSLKNQTYQDFFVCFVDDCSEDESVKYIKDNEFNFNERIKLIQSDKNEGPGLARNRALNEDLPGEYIIFLDVDDYFENDYFEKMINVAETNNVDLVICGLDRVEQDGNILCQEMIRNPEGKISDISNCEIFAYMIPVLWNKLFRKSCLSGTRFQDAARSEDTVFILENLPKIKSVQFINQVLYHYVIRNNTMTASLNEQMYDSMLRAFCYVAKLYSRDNRYKPYYEILETQAFIRCAVGGTYRLAFNNIKLARYYEQKARIYFDNYFPNWRKNSYLSFKNIINRGIKKNAISFCALLYKMHLFVVFIYVYWIVKNIFNRDVRF